MTERDLPTQIAEAKRAFTNLGVKIFGYTAEAVLKGALLVERDVKENMTPNGPSAPGEPPAVDTGRLRASITHRTMGSREYPVAEVGTNVEYGVYLEFGPTKVQKRPFMVPALERNRSTIQVFIADAVKRAADEASK